MKRKLFETSKYLKNKENEKANKSKIWNAAMGLQDVDNIKTSDFLFELASEHIEGKLKLEEVWKKVCEHYKSLTADEKLKCRSFEEADKVSIKIVEYLLDESFEFSLSEYFKIHKRLFDAILPNAGVIRNHNLTKEELILNFDSVTYSDHRSIMDKLKYDFELEDNCTYIHFTFVELVENISNFIANIWETHPFSEGNTRTTALFLIKYLKTFGFDVNEEVFAKKSLYFRNALVRANYFNRKQVIINDLGFLMNFVANLTGVENIPLDDKELYVKFD